MVKKKGGNTIDQIFGGSAPKSGAAEINWMLDVSQIDLRGLISEQQVDLFYRKIHEGVGRQKSQRRTPADVAFDFYYEPMVDKSIKFEKYKPTFSSPVDKKFIEKKVVDFLKGLSDAVHRLKTVLNKKQPKYFVPITKMLGPKTLRLGIRNGDLSVTFDWENYSTFGPFLLAQLLSESSAKSLRFCQSCKRLFYSTHYKQVYCSKNCRDDEQSIKSEKDRIIDQLKSRRAYLARTLEDNAKIAERLQDAGFIDTMRRSGFSKTEIDQLVPTVGKYRRNKKRGGR